MSNVVKRCVGDALVILKPDGRTGDGRCRFKGEVHAGGHRWAFQDLSFHGNCDAPKSFDRAAEEIVGFATNYDSLNRPDDPEELPDWAPSAEVADAIEEATSWAQNDRGDVQVKRGPCRTGR